MPPLTDKYLRSDLRCCHCGWYIQPPALNALLAWNSANSAMMVEPAKFTDPVGECRRLGMPELLIQEEQPYLEAAIPLLCQNPAHEQPGYVHPYCGDCPLVPGLF